MKLRAGQLPYKDDPQGWKSLLASTINQRNSGVRAFKVRQCWNSLQEKIKIKNYSETLNKHTSGVMDHFWRALWQKCKVGLCSTHHVWSWALGFELPWNFGLALQTCVTRTVTAHFCWTVEKVLWFEHLIGMIPVLYVKIIQQRNGEVQKNNTNLIWQVWFKSNHFFTGFPDINIISASSWLQKAKLCQ